MSGNAADLVGADPWVLLHWPRNFGIAFGVEMLIAQPIARFVMAVMHRAMDRGLGEREGSAA